MLYIENGMLPQILSSLSKRIPIQAEMFPLITKFLTTLCLNQEGQKIVLESNIIDSFVRSACDSRSYKFLVNLAKTHQNKDLF